MELYFVKATYTNNVYKLGDFFLNGDYKKIATKKLNINHMPSDEFTSFVTSKLTLPDNSNTIEHTHIIVPDYNKIYRIQRTEYINQGQYRFFLEEDAFIGNYLTVKDTDMIITRTNDSDLFRGANDIADLTLRETIIDRPIESDWKTGKWALLFYQYTDDTDYLGLTMQGAQIWEEYADMTAITAAYPEVTTTQPSKYSYFQKVVKNLSDGFTYQCVYDESGSNTRLRWVFYNALSITYDKVYVKKDFPSKVNPIEVKSYIIALPIESDLYSGTDRILEYGNFVGPEDSALLMDIKVVDSLLIKNDTITYALTGTDSIIMTKTVTFANKSARPSIVYSDNLGTVLSGLKVLVMYDFEEDIDISYESPVSFTPTDAEPFKKYDLYVYGRKFQVPYFFIDDIHLLISVVSGVINYIVYYKEKRNIVGAGSFTHSIKYQVDQLDSFYSQNPTYKDQFYTTLGINAVKTIAGGAIAGSAVPGVGTALGAATGVVKAGVDAGIGLVNLHYQEKNLRLKPDQIFGEISEIALQMINIFGVYWVKRSSDNDDLMRIEYGLRGFPTNKLTTIEDLDYELSSAIESVASTKIVYGELKKVVKNQYTTTRINEKLKEGIILLS